MSMAANAESQPKEQQQQQQSEDKPIPGPKPVRPEYTFEPDWERPVYSNLKFGRTLADLVRKPAHWIRENVVLPNKGPKYYWYHRKFERALPIDECYYDDLVCIYEANQEFKRNRLIDRATLDLLRYRRDNCHFWHVTNKGTVYTPAAEACKDLEDTYDREELNFFIKYGDMQTHSSVIFAYNKQKHRMIMERRKARALERGEVPVDQN